MLTIFAHAQKPITSRHFGVLTHHHDPTTSDLRTRRTRALRPCFFQQERCSDRFAIRRYHIDPHIRVCPFGSPSISSSFQPSLFYQSRHISIADPEPHNQPSKHTSVAGTVLQNPNQARTPASLACAAKPTTRTPSPFLLPPVDITAQLSLILLTSQPIGSFVFFPAPTKNPETKALPPILSFLQTVRCFLQQTNSTASSNTTH